MIRNVGSRSTFVPSHGTPPSGCRHLPPPAGEGFQTDASRFSFPYEAGEGAEGGWGQSWLGTYKVLRNQTLQSTLAAGCPIDAARGRVFQAADAYQLIQIKLAKRPLRAPSRRYE